MPTPPAQGVYHLRVALNDRAAFAVAHSDAFMIDHGRLRTDLLALIVLAVVVFLGLSLASYHPADPPSQLVYPPATEVRNYCGPVGAQVASWLMNGIGGGAWLLLLGLVIADWRLFRREEYSDPTLRVCGLVLALGAACIAIQQYAPPLPRGPLVGSGGYVGVWGTILLQKHFSHTGTLILLATCGSAGLLLAGELRTIRLVCEVAFLPITMWSRLAIPAAPSAAVRSTRQPFASTPRTAVAATAAAGTATPARPAGPLPQVPPPLPTAKPAKAFPLLGLTRSATTNSGPAADRPLALPTTELLEEPEEFPYETLAKKAQQLAAALEKAFQEFGLNVKVVEIDTGPVITQFELELEAGLRLNKVSALADDLAIALRVASVRVVAPIPGKNTVGVEVPNDVRVMVRMKELLEAARVEVDQKQIPIFLGKDVSGRPLTIDMCKMPHLLIAGRTGTGKSVCLNTLILSMLMSRTPDQVKMLMIDPKMVELSPYTRIPHLMHPVITDMKQAEAVLGWAVDKMEERYDLLAKCGVRHLDSYNKLGKAKVLQRLKIDPESEDAELIPEQMPYIVIIADEMADMMMTSGKDVEGHIIRLAQKSRAVGIHLVLATQKPTVDVITGLIKSNLPARISFQVSSRVDSRVVLDEMGAEKLLGHGDMLYMAPGTSHLTRGQGTFVSDEEVNRIIEFYADQEPQYSPELLQLVAGTATSQRAAKGEPAADRERDELYDQAVELVIREGRGSVSLLQRGLGVGYGRGARMIDWMAEDGVVGEYNGSQAREVIMTLDQWEELRSQ